MAEAIKLAEAGTFRKAGTYGAPIWPWHALNRKEIKVKNVKTLMVNWWSICRSGSEPRGWSAGGISSGGVGALWPAHRPAHSSWPQFSDKLLDQFCSAMVLAMFYNSLNCGPHSLQDMKFREEGRALAFQIIRSFLFEQEGDGCKS